MKSLIKRVSGVMVIVGAVIVSGCSRGPSNSMVEAQVKKSLESELIEVVSVKVVSSKEDPQVKNIYDEGYEADVKMKLDYAKLREELKGMDFLNGRGLEAAMTLNQLKGKYGEFKAGDVKKVKDTAFFEKTDKGWVMVQM